MITASDIYVQYGERILLDRITFVIGDRDRIGLVGRNGAGKSSTISCLVGQRKAASGECRIFDMDTWRSRRHVMARVGLVPETPDIPPGASARASGSITSLTLRSADVRARYGWEGIMKS